MEQIREKTYFVKQIKFRLHYLTYEQKVIEQLFCKNFRDTVYLLEPNRAIYIYHRDNGDMVSIIKEADSCYNVRYRGKGD